MVANKYFVKLMLLFLFANLTVFFRSYNAFRNPILHCEDGMMMFEFFTNNPDPVGIFRFYNGYISLIPNAVGYISTRFSPVLSPFIMGLYSILISSFSFCLFSFKRFRFAIVNDNVRIIICCILLMFPKGNAPLFSSTTWSSWNLLWIYLMFSLAPIPKKFWVIAFEFVFLSLAAWSHPLSVICIPIFSALVFIRKTMTEKIIALSHILIISLYLIFGVSEAQHGLQISFSTIRTTLYYLSKRVIFECSFGNSIRFFLYQKNQLLIMDVAAMIIITILAIVLIQIRKSIPHGAMCALLTYVMIIIIFTFLCVVTRGIAETSCMSEWGARYFYIQQMLFILISSSIFYHSLLSFKVRLIFPILFSFILCMAIFQNIFDYDYFNTSSYEGDRLRKFLCALNNGQNLDTYYDTATDQYVLKRKFSWDIRINKNALIYNKKRNNSQDIRRKPKFEN